MPIEDFKGRGPAADLGGDPTPQSTTPRTLWERRLEAARQQREEVLAGRSSDSVLEPNRDAPPPAGESPIDRAVAALGGAPASALNARNAAIDLWDQYAPRLRAGAPLALAFVLGLVLGLHIVAGPRAPVDTASLAVAPGTAAEFLATPEVMNAALPVAVATEPPPTFLQAAIAPPVLPAAFKFAGEPASDLALDIPTRSPVAVNMVFPAALPAFTLDGMPEIASATRAGSTRVFVTVPRTVQEEQLVGVPATLAAIGVTPASLARVNFTVKQTHTRYYHETDAGAAKRIADAMNGLARDFTSFSPKPDPGTIELYLSGQGAQDLLSPRLATGEVPQAARPFGSALQFLIPRP